MDGRRLAVGFEWVVRVRSNNQIDRGGAHRWFQFLLCAPRRDAGGTPDFFLSQAVALPTGDEFGQRLFLLLFPDGVSQFFLKSTKALVRPVDDGQVAAGNGINQPPPGRFAAILAAAIGGDAQQNLPVNVIQFQ